MNYNDFLVTLVWVLFFGICFGAFYSYYHKRLLGDILRELISVGATSEQTAVELEKIGYGKGGKRAFAQFALKKGSVLRKTIAVIGESCEQQHDPDELFVKKQKNESLKYYIPEEKLDTATKRFNGKGTTAASLIACIATFFIFAVIVISVLPWIIKSYYRLMNPVDDNPQTEISTDINNSTGDEQYTDLDKKQVQDSNGDDIDYSLN